MREVRATELDNSGFNPYFDDPYLDERINLDHSIIDISSIGYSRSAVESLLKTHHIDARSSTYETVIEMLYARVDPLAIDLIENNQLDKFLEHFTFGFINRLVERYPRLLDIISVPGWGSNSSLAYK